MKGKDIFNLAAKLLGKIQGLSRMQAIIAGVATVAAVGGIGTGGYFIYEHNHPQVEVVAEIEIPTEDTEEAESEAVSEDTELLAEEILVTEEIEAAESKVLTVVATAIGTDLKVKIQNENQKLVTGIKFVVDVKSDAKGAKAKSYEDKDKDGIISIADMDSGNYTVELQAVDGYEIKKGNVTVAVKDTIEYKKVDVASEIKTESQVNTAVEDTAVNDVQVEATLTDTVSLVESTVSASTVAKADVDNSNFTKATASSSTNSKILEKTVKVSTGGSTESTEDKNNSTESTGNNTESTGNSTESTGNNTEDKSNSGAESTNSTEDTPAAQGENGTASIVRNTASRVATAQGTAEVSTVSATVALPSTITLYNTSNATSTSYALSLSIAGDSSVIKSVEWKSTNDELAILSTNSGNSVTITKGDKYTAGTEANVAAIITYYTDEVGNTGSVTLQTTVKVANMTDSSTQLKDKSGNILYVDSSAKTVATLKDYASYSKFYTLPQYTGWQTIDGKVYYYTSAHVKVTGNQVIGGVQYTFAADGSLSQSSGSRGIDVSKYQGNIDWGAVASSGISFAIIRAGYRGASTGALIEDPYFKKNIAGATKAGIKVGVYFFTQAISEAEAIEEASMVLSLVSGYKVTYPIFIDSENASGGRANGLDSGTRTAVVKAFCQTIANGGYKAGVYASKSWFGSKLNASALSNYCIWVAQYNTSCTYSGKYNLWQYTSQGTVSGISGNVDMNISYLGY
jgi:GH25 family lysozyme M1 (1,4-beta-N-acetylmuramidase)